MAPPTAVEENDARASAQQDDPSPSTAASSEDDDDALDAQQQDNEWDEWGDDEGGNDANANDDDEDEEDSDRTRSLFDPPSAAPLPSPEAALAHDHRAHGFDLKAWRRRCGLDQYGVIRAVNWARRCVAEGQDPRPALRAYEEAVVASAASGKGAGAAPAPPPPAWAGDEFLVPALPDDPLVTYDYEEEEEGEEDGGGEQEVGGEEGEAAGAAPAASAAAAGDQQQLLIQRLAAENAALRTRLQALVEATLPEELRDECALVGGSGGSGSGGAAGPSSSTAATTTNPSTNPQTTSTAALIDAAYFDSYSHFDIHREMLSDAPRTQAYRDALERNPALTKGKTVVDVGAGTGVLSLFAARGGQAAAVVGIEGSARMARIARAVAAANGLAREQGGAVAIVSGRVEALVQAAGGGKGGDDSNANNANNDTTTTTTAATLALLPKPNSADVLVSEWMGYALLFESMLSSVLTARDAWLKPGGAVLPDVARVVVAGGDLRAALGCAFWDDVYGLRMTPIGDEVVQGVAGAGAGGVEAKDKEKGVAADAAAAPPAPQRPRRRPRLLVRQVPASALRTASAEVRELDLATMSHDDQDFTAEFECALLLPQEGKAGGGGGPPTPAKAGGGGGGNAPPAPAGATTTTPTTISCLVLWFDTLFTERFCSDHPVVLSTAPTSAPTHWAQAVLPLSRPVELSAASLGGSSLRGRLSMARRQGRHRALDISLEYRSSSSCKPVVDLFSMGVNQDEDELEAEMAVAAANGGTSGLAVGASGARPEATIA